MGRKSQEIAIEEAPNSTLEADMQISNCKTREEMADKTFVQCLSVFYGTVLKRKRWNQLISWKVACLFKPDDIQITLTKHRHVFMLFSTDLMKFPKKYWMEWSVDWTLKSKI